ncbi:MAG: 2-phosphosulfolactate phosphatase [candidate division Zixibacteria bacterium]|jgi:2-phosphosulfolactate phosphatase|nr:2-phosphosulfolactate phosphatase [candidate division Zixibacteria bacterium]
MHVRLFLTSAPMDKAEMEEKTVVVIDVLRATTSICAALQAGAKGVIPTAGPGEAGDMRAKLGGDAVVLAGERNGVKIENFQLGNSPTEFTPESVGGKYVVMTTTNGTLALSRANKGWKVVTAGLVNVSKVAEAIAADDRDLLLVCSGREGHFSIEDTICGGMLIHRLASLRKGELELNDAASLALLLYRTNQSSIRQAIAQGEHARFLASIGFEHDVVVATEVDSMPVLPVLKDGRLVSEDQ